MRFLALVTQVSATLMPNFFFPVKESQRLVSEPLSTGKGPKSLSRRVSSISKPHFII